MINAINDSTSDQNEKPNGPDGSIFNYEMIMWLQTKSLGDKIVIANHIQHGVPEAAKKLIADRVYLAGFAGYYDKEDKEALYTEIENLKQVIEYYESVGSWTEE